MAAAQDAAQSLSLVDDLELRIEIGQHERLIKRRTKDGTTLAAFATDGCSGNLSTGWELVSKTLPAVAKHHGERPPWEGCCVAHDRLYHEGGAANLDAKGSFAARRAADEQLRQCVVRTGEDRLDALSADYKLSRDEVARILSHHRRRDVPRRPLWRRSLHRAGVALGLWLAPMRLGASQVTTLARQAGGPAACRHLTPSGRMTRRPSEEGAQVWIFYPFPRAMSAAGRPGRRSFRPCSSYAARLPNS